MTGDALGVAGHRRSAAEHDVIAPLPRTIAIVLDTEFALRLASLADRAAVWVVDSPANRPAIESLWTARRTRAAAYDITVFRTIPGLTAEEHVEGVLRSAQRHAEADEPLPPVGRVEVYGAALTDTMREMFQRHDYSRIESTADGFSARRNPE